MPHGSLLHDDRTLPVLVGQPEIKWTRGGQRIIAKSVASRHRHTVSNRIGRRYFPGRHPGRNRGAFGAGAADLRRGDGSVLDHGPIVHGRIFLKMALSVRSSMTDR